LSVPLGNLEKLQSQITNSSRLSRSLAGNWVKLNLAEDSWELGDLLEERLARQSTLLQGASQSRWVRDTGKLNRLLLDGQWLGKAGLDHLLGDAKLGGLLVNNVGHASWLVHDRHALVQLGDWGWDDDLTGAPVGLALELFLDGSWESRATFKSSGGRLEQIGVGSQGWPHDTHAWGLQVSRALTVHVTAKTDSARLQELWGNNLNPESIRHDLQALLWDKDRHNIVLKTLNDSDGLALSVLLDELLTSSWPQHLLVDNNLKGARVSWGDRGLSDARQNLDSHLSCSCAGAGGDSHWNVLGAIHKKNVLTVVNLVFNSLVVESGQESWLNTAGGWHVLARHLDGNNLQWRVQPGGWEDVLGQAHQAHVPQDKLPGWSLDLGSDKVGGAVSTSLNQDLALDSAGKFLALNVAEKKSLGNTVQKGHEGRLSPGLWGLNGQVDLVKGSSLATDKGADWGKGQLAALLSHALLELWRLTDLPLELLSLFQFSVDLDVLHVGGLTERKLGLNNGPKWLLEHLLNVEPVLQFWQLKLAFVGEAVGLTRAGDWGNLKGSNVGTLRLLAQNNDGSDLVQWRSRRGLGHANDFNNIGLLNLRKDAANMGELGRDLVLSDDPLGQGVHHALGGEPEDNVEFLGLGPGWVVLNPEGGHPDGRWEQARWDDGKWSVLGDLLDVGVQVCEHGLRLVDQLARKAKGLTNFHFNWLPLDSGGNLLETSRVSDWSDLEEVVLESVWLDESMEGLGVTSRALNLRWGLDGQLNLTTGDLALNLNWDGRVHGHVDTRANELLGEWSDDTEGSLELAVQDWDKLGREPWGVVLHTRDLDGSLDSIDNWQSGGRHDWETSLSDVHVGGLIDLGGANLVEFHVKSRLELPGELLKGFQDNLRVQVQGGFNASPRAVQEGEWSRHFPGLQLQLFGDHVQLGLDGWGRDFLSREEVQVLLQQEVHAKGVGREFNGWDLEGVGWAIVDSLHGELVWDQRLLGVDQLKLVVDESPHVLNIG